MGVKGKVLVVEDEEVIRDIFQDVITAKFKDVEVETAKTSEEGIEKAMAEDFDLIFMNMRLRKKNGLTTFRDIRKMKPNQKICMVTGYMPEKRVEDALKEGACGAICRPFKVEEILKVVKKYLKK